MCVGERSAVSPSYLPFLGPNLYLLYLHEKQELKNGLIGIDSPSHPKELPYETGQNIWGNCW